MSLSSSTGSESFHFRRNKMARKNQNEGVTAGDQAQADAADAKITDLTLGNINLEDLTGLGFEEVDPLKGIDAAYNAGQEGFLAGTTKLGYFEGTKLCVSTEDKKPNWKPHPELEDKVCRKLHIFRSVNPKDGELLKTYFGIWSAGCLDAMLKRIKTQQTIAVTYEGQAEKAFKKNQTPPHVFKLRGKGLEMKITDLMDIESDVQGVEAVASQQAAS
jgi:hypothetical protein